MVPQAEPVMARGPSQHHLPQMPPEMPASLGAGTRLYRWWFDNGKWGYLDDRGEVAIAPRFDWVDGFYGGFSVVRSASGKYGLIGRDGKYVLRPQFRWLSHPSDGLCIFKRRGLGGAVDLDGRVVIPPKFHVLSDFVDGVAKAAWDRDHWGFVDRKGNPLVEFCYDFVHDYSCRLAYFELGQTNGFLDRNFRIRFGPTNCRHYSCSFEDGVVWFRQEGKIGFMKKDGRVIVPPTFARAHDFSEGLAWVRVGRLWGAINKRGEFAFEPKIATFVGRGRTPSKISVCSPQLFHCGLTRVFVKRNGERRLGYVDRRGDFYFEPIFDLGGEFKNGLVKVTFPSEKKSSLINIDGDVLFGPRRGEKLR